MRAAGRLPAHWRSRSVHSAAGGTRGGCRQLQLRVSEGLGRRSDVRHTDLPRRRPLLRSGLLPDGSGARRLLRVLQRLWRRRLLSAHMRHRLRCGGVRRSGRGVATRRLSGWPVHVSCGMDRRCVRGSAVPFELRSRPVRHQDCRVRLRWRLDGRCVRSSRMPNGLRPRFVPRDLWRWRLRVPLRGRLAWRRVRRAEVSARLRGARRVRAQRHVFLCAGLPWQGL